MHDAWGKIAGLYEVLILTAPGLGSLLLMILLNCVFLDNGFLMKLLRENFVSIWDIFKF